MSPHESAWFVLKGKGVGVRYPQEAILMNLKLKNGFEVEPEMRVEEDEYKECAVCHQEYTGVCPMVCADCPFSARDEVDEEDEKEPDFDDVDRLDKLLVEDKESERLVAEASEIPAEELKDD